MRTIARARAAGAALLALAIAVLPAARAAGEPAAASAWSLSAHSVHHSDALSLEAIDREAWSELAPRPGRNLTYLDDEIRLGWRRGEGSITLLARQYATLVASADTLRLVAQVSGRAQPADDQAYDVDLQARGFSGIGLALGLAAAPAAGWRWHGEVQMLGLGRWLERRIEGPVSYRAADASYEFDVHSFELDNRLDFPFQQPFARRGAGLLLATGASWQGEGAWVHAELLDGGWLHWRGVPQQQGTLSTATRSVDGDGFLIYLPLIQGSNSQDGRTRWQPWRGSVAAGLLVAERHEVGLRVETVPGFGALPVLTWQRLAGGAQSPGFGVEWRTHERRLDLRANWRGFTLDAGADRLGAGAHSRRLAIAYTTIR